MFELQGKYASTKVFTDVIDNEGISQIINLLNQPYMEGCTIRMMPDVHAGAGCTVGTTMTIKDKVCPNLVGVDIGCGMETVKLKEDHIDLPKLDSVIRATVPSGFGLQAQPHRFAKGIDLTQLHCAKKAKLQRASLSIGTLGGGNHFIEADVDNDGSIYLVVHSGSRQLGAGVAAYYQREAYKSLTEYSKDEIAAIVDELKAAGRKDDIPGTLKNLGEKPCPVPKDLAYVEGSLFEQYLHDMQITQEFASLNRKAIIDSILTGMGLHADDQFSTVHNYIDLDDMILRKGAVSAKASERLLIPINMRDGSLLCVGKGNPDWNFSAPHGAGRLMSRSAAKEAFTVEEFKAQMEGIYSTSVNQSTLNECPMAYKSMQDIVDNIGPTAGIVKVLKPIYNFKAGRDDS